MIQIKEVTFKGFLQNVYSEFGQKSKGIKRVNKIFSVPKPGRIAAQTSCKKCSTKTTFVHWSNKFFKSSCLAFDVTAIGLPISYDISGGLNTPNKTSFLRHIFSLNPLCVNSMIRQRVMSHSCVTQLKQRFGQ